MFDGIQASAGGKVTGTALGRWGVPLLVFSAMELNIDAIVGGVALDGGIKEISMRLIKQCAAPDRNRLSADLSHQISRELESLGLVTFPRRLPTSENASVWVMAASHPLAQVVLIASAYASLDRSGRNPLPELFEKYALARDGLL